MVRRYFCCCFKYIINCKSIKICSQKRILSLACWTENWKEKLYCCCFCVFYIYLGAPTNLVLHFLEHCACLPNSRKSTQTSHFLTIAHFMTFFYFTLTSAHPPRHTQVKLEFFPPVKLNYCTNSSKWIKLTPHLLRWCCCNQRISLFLF